MMEIPEWNNIRPRNIWKNYLNGYNNKSICHLLVQNVENAVNVVMDTCTRIGRNLRPRHIIWTWPPTTLFGRIPNTYCIMTITTSGTIQISLVVLL
jgi:hypothetical protein